MYAANYRDTMMKRLTVITRVIQEILRIKMQYISIIKLSLRLILNDSVKTEFTYNHSDYLRQ